jgi:hypothetical protein
VADQNRVRHLCIAMIVVGLIFIFGVYPLMMSLWPSGWRWSPNQPQSGAIFLCGKLGRGTKKEKSSKKKEQRAYGN